MRHVFSRNRQSARAAFVLAGLVALWGAPITAWGVPPPPPPPPPTGGSTGGTATTCTSFTYSAWSTCTNGTQTRTVLTRTPSGCTGGSPVTSQSCTATVTCTGFTYSAWSSCTNGTQTRTVLTRTPSGCTGGSPVTSQSCTGGTTGGTTTGTPPAPTTTPGSTGGTTPPPPTTTPGGSTGGGTTTRTFGNADIALLFQNWLGTATAAIDVNGDGKVNMRDLGIMLSRWATGGSGTGGTTPPPPSTTPGGTGSTTCTGFTYSGWGTCSNGTQTRTVLTRTPSGCTGGSPVTSQSCTGGTGTIPPPPPPPPIGG